MNRKWALFAGILFLVGCAKDTVKSAPPSPPAPGPIAAAPAAPVAGGDLSGKVAEKIDAANYTYLRLTTATGEVWAAVPTTDVAVGAEVSIASPMPMQNFESKTLKRTFEVIMFGAGVQVSGAAAAAPAAANPHAANPHAAPEGTAPAPTTVDEKIARAEGSDARAVAELYRDKASLSGKPVAVRGKVTKVTTGVMGRTWLHLRDGSGTAATGDNDLTVTTAATVAVGDVVTVKGVVHLDKDLGSGYAFPVLLEDAAVLK